MTERLDVQDFKQYFLSSTKHWVYPSLGMKHGDDEGRRERWKSIHSLQFTHMHSSEDNDTFILLPLHFTLMSFSRETCFAAITEIGEMQYVIRDRMKIIREGRGSQMFFAPSV